MKKTIAVMSLLLCLIPVQGMSEQLLELPGTGIAKLSPVGQAQQPDSALLLPGEMVKDEELMQVAGRSSNVQLPLLANLSQKMGLATPRIKLWDEADKIPKINTFPTPGGAVRSP